MVGVIELTEKLRLSRHAIQKAIGSLMENGLVGVGMLRRLDRYAAESNVRFGAHNTNSRAEEFL
jgi:DNA-binding GntR family transcriptional regulator